ncbi:MAG: right-handed parallel beta-helix repeat-containing protein [Candidatus Electryoneaceae bacterium]|nr:right-handed parallel beta-helix repeat-containing protein [Candidatus Electryoneaceae bacterium]
MKFLVIAIILFLSITTILQADIINIPEDFQIIERAIYTADTGDTILIRPGTYTENIYLHNKDIVIASLFLTTGDRSYIDSTIINGRNGNHVVTFREVTEETIFVGFTITGGSEAGIYCSFEAAPIISNCIITGNTGSYGGGFFVMNDSNPDIRDCRITDNRCGWGGGILVWNANATISNCVISDNYASSGGGGIFFWDSDTNLFVRNSTIYHNSTTENGGGINCRGSNPIIQNCTVSRNEARGYGSVIHVWGYSNATVLNSIFWANSKSEIGLGYDGRNVIYIDYSDIGGGEPLGNQNDRVHWGEGNLETNPMFVNSPNGDFYLQELSPCIDAGDPESELDPDDTRADIGACFFDHRNQDVVDQRPDNFPNLFTLESVYPNPFNAAATITFNLPFSSNLLLTVYDMSGREVAVLADGMFLTGRHNIHWNAGHLSSGMYQARLTTPESSQTVRMILVK